MFRKKLRKIQNQLLLLLIVCTIIPVLFVSLYSITSSTQSLTSLTVNRLEDQVQEKANTIQAFLDSVKEDVMFLSKVPPIQGIIRARDAEGIDEQGASSYPVWVERLETIFVAMSESKPHYLQLRYLDENGNEMVRVDSRNNIIQRVPPSNLQNKGERDYFIETMQLEPGEMYVSEVNLNREQGQIEKPIVPVIRYATPIVDSQGQKRGIVIANVSATQFLDIQDEDLTQGAEVVIVNQRGDYLSHPDSDKEWGFELDTDANLKEDYPLEIANQILNEQQGAITDEISQILSYYTIFPDQNEGKSLTLITTVPRAVLFASITRLKALTVAIILISLSLVLTLGIFRIRRIANSIKSLVHGISSFSEKIFSTLEKQEKIATEQSNSVNEITTTVEEIGSSSEQTARQAERVASGAKQGLSLAESGTKLIEETLQGLVSLQDKMNVITNQSHRLGDQTSQIINISALAGLVSDLANQTNMLALNASVEAVRAGEHGKGFAVVATEIRKLADQSRDAAEKINAIVPEIQKVIRETVKASEAGSKTLESGLEIAQETTQTFTGVREAANDVFISNQQISFNANHQADDIQNVVQAMSLINQGVAETASGIRQTKVGVEELYERAQDLKSIV